MLGPMTIGAFSSEVAGGEVPFPSLTGVLQRLESDLGTFQDSAKTTPAASDGDVVGGFEDQSANGADLIQATTASKPVLKTGIVNGEPVVRGDQTDDVLSGALDGTTLTALTVFWVVAPKGTTGNTGLWSWGEVLTSSKPFVLLSRQDATNLRIFIDNGYRFTGLAHAVDVFKIYSLTASGTTWRLRINGVQQSDYTGGFNNQTNAQNIYLNNGFSGYAGTDFAASLVCDSVLSSGDIESVEGYYAAKYGITLP